MREVAGVRLPDKMVHKHGRVTSRIAREEKQDTRLACVVWRRSAGEPPTLLWRGWGSGAPVGVLDHIFRGVVVLGGNLNPHIPQGVQPIGEGFRDELIRDQRSDPRRLELADNYVCFKQRFAINDGDQVKLRLLRRQWAYLVSRPGGLGSPCGRGWAGGREFSPTLEAVSRVLVILASTIAAFLHGSFTELASPNAGVALSAKLA
jgi:hypothetical protein